MLQNLPITPSGISFFLAHYSQNYVYIAIITLQINRCEPHFRNVYSGLTVF